MFSFLEVSWKTTTCWDLYISVCCFILVPPRNLRIEAQKETTVEGEEIELNCTSLASRPPTVIRWFKGNKELFGRPPSPSINLMVWLWFFRDGFADKQDTLVMMWENNSKQQKGIFFSLRAAFHYGQPSAGCMPGVGGTRDSKWAEQQVWLLPPVGHIQTTQKPEIPMSPPPLTHIHHLHPPGKLEALP